MAAAVEGQGVDVRDGRMQRQGQDRGQKRGMGKRRGEAAESTHHVGREGVVVGGEVVPVWFIV